jgi:hypothetical protein
MTTITASHSETQLDATATNIGSHHAPGTRDDAPGTTPAHVAHGPVAPPRTAHADVLPTAQ